MTIILKMSKMTGSTHQCPLDYVLIKKIFQTLTIMIHLPRYENVLFFVLRLFNSRLLSLSSSFYSYKLLVNDGCSPPLIFHDGIIFLIRSWPPAILFISESSSSVKSKMKSGRGEPSGSFVYSFRSSSKNGWAKAYNAEIRRPGS